MYIFMGLVLVVLVFYVRILFRKKNKEQKDIEDIFTEIHSKQEASENAYFSSTTKHISTQVKAHKRAPVAPVVLPESTPIMPIILPSSDFDSSPVMAVEHHKHDYHGSGGHFGGGGASGDYSQSHSSSHDSSSSHSSSHSHSHDSGSSSSFDSGSSSSSND